MSFGGFVAYLGAPVGSDAINLFRNEATDEAVLPNGEKKAPSKGWAFL